MLIHAVHHPSGELFVPSDDASRTFTLPTGVCPSSSTKTAHAGAAATTTAGTAQGTVTLRTVDFGYQREYLYAHPLFCTSRAVHALCAPLDKLFGKPPAEVVNTLREYASMVKVRAPDAPVVVVFTKADQVTGVAPDAMPAAATRWMHDVITALRAEFSQVAGGDDGDKSTCSTVGTSTLVLSSKDGWEANRANAVGRWAQLALASPGTGDILPASYGKLRDALGVAGAAWKKNTDDYVIAAGVEVSMEETKIMEGGLSLPVDATTASNVPLAMQWGSQVPIATVAAVRAMAVEHCGLSRDADIHQPLLLLHHMGCVVHGGALAHSDPSHDGIQSAPDDFGDDHMPSHLDLSQLVVLDPQWLANVFSRVVTQYARHHDDSGNPIPRGQMPLRDVALAWHGYPDELRGSFLGMLFALELAYPGLSGTIIVPAVLPDMPSNEDEVAAVTSLRSLQKQVCDVDADCKCVVAYESCDLLGACVQIHVCMRSSELSPLIPTALFLQLLPRLAAAFRPLSQWRARAIFSAQDRQGDSSATRSIVELQLCSGVLHVSGMVATLVSQSGLIGVVCGVGYPDQGVGRGAHFDVCSCGVRSAVAMSNVLLRRRVDPPCGLVLHSRL